MGIYQKIKEMVIGENANYLELITDGAIVIDVRGEREFKSGHANGSINIPLHDLASEMHDLKGKEVILVCRSGARASTAKSLLKKYGITAYNAGAWQAIDEILN